MVVDLTKFDPLIAQSAEETGLNLDRASDRRGLIRPSCLESYIAHVLKYACVERTEQEQSFLRKLDSRHLFCYHIRRSPSSAYVAEAGLWLKANLEEIDKHA